MFDVITIGSATLDVFIESDAANIVSVATKSHKSEFMSFPYGSKCEIDGFQAAVGGGAVNTAFNFTNLGLKTSTIIKIGKDFQGLTITNKLKYSNIDTSNIILDETGAKSGFSIILTSFQGDRTVLAHRGTNANITEKDINFEAIKKSKWLYIAPLNGATAKTLDKIAHFAEKNNINMAINVGTTSIKQGEKYLQKIIETAEVLVLNKEEAIMLTKIQIRPDSTKEKFSEEKIHPDLKKILNKLISLHAKIVILTDGKNGVWAYDGQKYYKCPQFPAKVASTLGAGDAFASTFVATINKYNWDIIKALKYASVNAAAVVEKFGAQEGFITFEEIEARLKKTPLEVEVMTF